MNNFLESKLDQIEAAVNKTTETFKDLNAEQLNYKPDPKNWSIAQCLDHLMITDKMYEPVLKDMANRRYRPGFWARRGWGAKFFGKMLIAATAPVPDRKGKTIPSFEPSHSELPADIVELYRHHNRDWRSLLGRLEGLDYTGTRLSSPAGAFITYSLEDLLTLLANHKERHHHQAVAVMRSEGFPR